MDEKNVLIVEDHKDISDMLCAFLETNGYHTECAYDGRKASSLLAEKEYTIVLMDLMLPYKDGAALIRELRAHSSTPVICLSAKSELETRLDVLRMGADDYLLKPFDLGEVLVRMEVVLRRANAPQESETARTKILSYGSIRLYPEENRATCADAELTLTLKEFLLLKLFLENPKKTFTKANLYESVWQEEYCYEDNTVNVHMSNLRNKLKKASGQDVIDTVWGIGYRLKEE